MSDKSFTLLEIRLGDGEIQIGPKSLGRGDDAADGPGISDALPITDDDDGSAKRSCPCPMCSDGCDCLACKLGKVALVLGLLGVLVLVAWKALAGGEFEDFDEIDELAD